MVELFLALSAIFLTVVVPITAFVALVRSRRLQRQLEEVSNGLAAVRKQVLHLAEKVSVAGDDDSPAEESGRAFKAGTRSIPSQSIPSDVPRQPAAPPSSQSDLPSRISAPQSPVVKKLEERLTGSWLIWLGGIATALGGVFLVKYAFERDLLGPGMRVSLGSLMGTLFVVAGEWLRRKPLHKTIAALRPDYVPPAITAAGIAALFASIYAAHGLYDLISPGINLLLLATVSFGSFALALLQGPFIAVLGLVGAYAVPGMVSAEHPSAWTLFAFLLFITAGSLAVVRYKGWWWLAWLSLAGSILWTLFWLVALWQPADTLVLVIYLLTLMSFFILFRFGTEDHDAQEKPGSFNPADLSPPRLVVVGAAATIALSSFVLVRLDSYGAMSLAELGIICVLFFIVGRREPSFDGLPVLAAILAVITLATWHLPEFIQSPPPKILADRASGFGHGPVVPPELEPFVWVCASFALLFGVSGFAALKTVARPALWSALSSGIPILILIVAYWRIASFQVNLAWAFISLGLAALCLAAAARVASQRAMPGMNGALGSYAVGSVAAVSLAATMALEQAWLTVAISLQLPALAWVHDRLRLRPLRHVALILASAVVVRLVLNPDILDYSLGPVPGFNWILYGYGLPAGAFLLAARWFRKTDDRLVVILESSALILGVLLVSLEIRHLVGEGRLDHGRYGLLEQSLHSIAWLATAYGLFRQTRKSARLAYVWGWRILAGLAVFQVVLLQCLTSNPLFTGTSVWEAPLINLLFLAYGMPAVFSLMINREARHQGNHFVAKVAGTFALALIFMIWRLLSRRRPFSSPFSSSAAPLRERTSASRGSRPW